MCAFETEAGLCLFGDDGHMQELTSNTIHKNNI